MNIFKKNKINLYLKNSFKHNFDRESFLEFKNLYEKNIKNSSVSIKKKSLNKLKRWQYLDEMLIHETGRFFSIRGLDVEINEKVWEQPIIYQTEIGVLGLIGRIIENRIDFLVQFKFEPGNLNFIQISPTIQATKSNLDKVHKGKKVLYQELIQNNFENEIVLLDSELSEQNSKFYKKKNRNIIKILDKKLIQKEENFVWLSLGKIKQLCLEDNIVNMDLRSILSGVSFHEDEENSEINNVNFDSLYERELSLFSYQKINSLMGKYNDYNNQNIRLIKFKELKNLRDWSLSEGVLKYKIKKFFRILGMQISSKGREIEKWDQPLLQSVEPENNVLFLFKEKDSLLVLVQFKIECGCSEVSEIGPTIQFNGYEEIDETESFLISLYKNGNQNLKFKVKQSEEGGRFFREENLNILKELDLREKEMINNKISSQKYNWIELGNLIKLISIGGPINMQLRSVISIISLETII